MKKIFFETLKHKFGHYLLVILCGILMVSTIYVSYAFSDSIEGIIHGQNSGIVEEMYTFINFQETYILLFILMVLVIISYIQKKSYDYVLLDTMGLKKKHRYMFIGFEYAGIIFSSVTGGLILGKILAECAKTVLQNIFYNTITTEVNYGFIALRNTLVISCEVFGILFIVFDELIALVSTLIETETMSTYDNEDSCEKIDYFRHIRNAVAHSKCNYFSDRGKNFVIFSDSNNNGSKVCSIKMECYKVGIILMELQRLIMEYYNQNH